MFGASPLLDPQLFAIGPFGGGPRVAQHGELGPKYMEFFLTGFAEP